MSDPKTTDPTFPPLLDGHGVSVPDQPMSTAVAGMRDGTLGAGAVVWARNTNVLDWAVVLEPEVALAQALQMVPLVMVAAGDCIGALTPPQVGLMFRWPGDILVNGGHAGHVDVVASTSDVSAVPDWLVVRLLVRLRGDDRHEPGERPDDTSLDEEGCGELTRNQMIESYSRHFMTWLNTWTEDGFHSVHSNWLYRASGLNERFEVSTKDGVRGGIFAGLDEDGSLLMKATDGSMSLITLGDVLLRDAVA